MFKTCTPGDSAFVPIRTGLHSSMVVFFGLQALTWLIIGFLFVLTLFVGLVGFGIYLPAFQFLVDAVIGSRFNLMLTAVVVSLLLLFAFHFLIRRQSSKLLSSTLIANTLLPVIVYGLSVWQQPYVTEQTLVGYYRNHNVQAIDTFLNGLGNVAEFSPAVAQQFWQIAVCENFDLEPETIGRFETVFTVPKIKLNVSCVSPPAKYKTGLEYLIAKEAPFYVKGGKKGGITE
jgi:hypothetical protein